MSGGTFDYKNLILQDIAFRLKNDKFEDYSERTKFVLNEIGEKTDILSRILQSVDYLLAGDIDEYRFNENVWFELSKYRFFDTVEHGVCPTCGNVFYKTIMSQKYCSDKCKRRFQNKKYYEKIHKHNDKKN